MLCRSTEVYAAEIKIPAYDAKKFTSTPASTAKAGRVGMAASTKAICAIVGVAVIGGVVAGGVLWNNSHKEEAEEDYIAGDWMAADGSEFSISMYTDDVEDGGACGNVRGFGESSYEIFNTEQNIYTLTTSDGKQYTLVANANSPEENARENTAEKAQAMNENADPALSGIYQPIEVLESYGRIPATSMDLFIDGEFAATYYIQYFYVS